MELRFFTLVPLSLVGCLLLSEAGAEQTPMGTGRTAPVEQEKEIVWRNLSLGVDRDVALLEGVGACGYSSVGMLIQNNRAKVKDVEIGFADGSTQTLVFARKEFGKGDRSEFVALAGHDKCVKNVQINGRINGFGGMPRVHLKGKRTSNTGLAKMQVQVGARVSQWLPNPKAACGIAKLQLWVTGGSLRLGSVQILLETNEKLPLSAAALAGSAVVDLGSERCVKGVFVDAMALPLDGQRSPPPVSLEVIGYR